ncbi:S9 family peptidase [Pelagibacteraceae bacterium]|nr:S9 family peptidase [Pelagibacteraceae bacterium]
MKNTIPKLRKETKVIKIHNDELNDDYAWIKQDNWQEVLQKPQVLNSEVLNYLNEENKFTDSQLEDQKTLKQTIFKELKGRIKDKDSSVPIKDGNFSYFMEYAEGSEYPCYKRSNLGKTDVIFDAQKRSIGQKFFNIASISHSHDHRCIAYNIDKNGSENYLLSVEDLVEGKIITKDIPDTTGEIVWDTNNQFIYYIGLDNNQRPNKIFQHKIGENYKKDILIFEEKDSAFFCSVSISQSKKYLLIRTADHQTSEYYTKDLSQINAPIKLFSKRVEKEEYEIDHREGHFYILTNYNECKNFKIMVCEETCFSKENWKEFILYKKNILILDFLILKKWIIYLQRFDGLNQIVIRNLDNDEEHTIHFDEKAYELDLSDQYEFDTDWIRFSFSSPITPKSIFDYNCKTKERVLKKTQEIPSGFDSNLYTCERFFCESHDGAEVPITVFYKKDLKLDGSNPLLLYGYGSYGITIPDSFSTSRFSLIDRGFIYAIAHIRGGREKGQEWYEEGKLLKKKNTFLDFIACAEMLCKKKYTSPKKIIAQGGSAGGLLMGYISNERPDLFLGIIAQVPFVDICNTMLDEDLPLTVTEIPEWGDLKNNQEAFEYIRSYSPYDNVKKQEYPHMLITGGVTDPRVTYWEMTKWTAKIRDYKKDSNLLLLKMNMDAGHSGASGRYDYLNEIALDYIFCLKVTSQ